MAYKYDYSKKKNEHIKVNGYDCILHFDNDKKYLGRKYGKLTIVELLRNYKKNLYARCICECGGEKIASISNLMNNTTWNCGCTRKKVGRRKKQEKLIFKKENKKRYCKNCGKLIRNGNRYYCVNCHNTLSKTRGDNANQIIAIHI